MGLFFFNLIRCSMLGLLWSIVEYAGWGLLLLALSTFLIPVCLQALSGKQDLKKKYKASWALVTGGSSGIGRGLCEHLAEQGLNIVIVALDDDLLKSFHKTLTEKYPQLEFRAIGVDLSQSEAALAQVAEATQDIDVQIVFNNAGYILFGLFAQLSLKAQMTNYHVNCTTSVLIAHHFATKMVEKKLKGCLSFTSSPAGQMPGPMAAMYGGTKAFLTNFATSLACELRPDGIDVFVMHPSPVNTNFYSNDSVKNSSSMNFFKKTSSSPYQIAGDMINNLGRFGCVIRNQGYFALGLQFLLRLVDIQMISILMRDTICLNGEYRAMRKPKSS